MKLNLTPFPKLTTERLVLRQLENKDAGRIFMLRSSDIVNQYIDRPRANSEEDAMQFIQKINSGMAINQCPYWAIDLKQSNQLIGTICLWNISVEEKKAEIGYELLPEFQGKGLMQEAITAVIDYAFNEMELDSIDAVFHPQNLRSIRLLEKNSFKQDTRPEHQVANMIVYSRRKENLE